MGAGGTLSLVVSVREQEGSTLIASGQEVGRHLLLFGGEKKLLFLPTRF